MKMNVVTLSNSTHSANLITAAAAAAAAAVFICVSNEPRDY